MSARNAISDFVKGESGAVSADWTVLTAAIVGLGLVMMNAVGEGADEIAENTSTAYATPRVTLDDGSGGDDGLNGDGGQLTY